MAAISKAWGSVVVLNYLIDLDILDINLNFLVSYSCLLNHCVVKVVVAIIVYKRPMFINPWNGFSQDLDICSRYAASLLFQDVLIFFSWSIVLYISNVGTWTIRFWQQIVDDRIWIVSQYSIFLCCFQLEANNFQKDLRNKYCKAWDDFNRVLSSSLFSYWNKLNIFKIDKYS